MPPQTQIIEVDDATTSAGLSNAAASPSSVYAEPEKNTKDKDVRDMLRTLLDRKWFILAITALALIAAFVMTLSMTPTYRAEAIMKIEPEDRNAIKLDIGVSGGVATEEYYRTQYRLLQSKAIARKVIDSLKLEDMFSAKNVPVAKPFYAEFIEDLRHQLNPNAQKEALAASKNMPATNSAEAALLGGLSVTRVGKSHLVSIAYESTNPELSANIVNSLTREFIKTNLDSRLDSASHAKLFLGDEIKDAKAKLDASKAEMIAYEKQYNVVDTSGDNSTLMRQRLLSINKAYSDAKQQRIAIESSQDDAKNSASTVRLLPETNLAIGSLERQVKVLESKYNRLNKAYQEQLQTYKPTFPGMAEKKTAVDEVKTQIEMLQANIQEEKESIALENNRRLAEAKRLEKPSKSSQLAAARQKETAMKAELDAVKAESIASREHAIKYKELEAQVESDRQIHENLLKKQKEVGIAGGIDKNNISVIDPAVVTYTPYKPNTKMNLAFGGLAGLLIGSMLALLLGTSDKKIKTVEDIREVSDLPLLGKIPKVKTQNNGAVQALDNPSSMIAEAFRSLRTSLMFATPEGLPKLLHITSSEADEGKSNIAHNLAQVFSQTGKSVLLIDADLRKPSIGKYLNLANTIGLETYLQGDAPMRDIITTTDKPNLSVIASGVVSSAPADLLSNDRMLNLLESVADQFELIILDSPPVLGLADALILSNRSVATLFVIESNKTNQQSLSDALERLRMGYGNVIGFILSKSKKLKSKEYTYKYGDAERLG